MLFRSEQSSPTLLSRDYAKNVCHKLNGYSFNDRASMSRRGDSISGSNRAVENSQPFGFSVRDTRSLRPGAATVSAKSIQNALVYERPCGSITDGVVEVLDGNVLKKEQQHHVLSFETVGNVLRFYSMPLLSAQPDVRSNSPSTFQQLWT